MQRFAKWLSTKTASWLMLAMACIGPVSAPIILMSTPGCLSSQDNIKNSEEYKRAEAAAEKAEALAKDLEAGKQVAEAELAAARKEVADSRAALAAKQVEAEEMKRKSDTQVDTAGATVGGVIKVVEPVAATVPFGTLIASQLPSLISIAGLIVKEFTGHKANVDNINWLDSRLEKVEVRLGVKPPNPTAT